MLLFWLFLVDLAVTSGGEIEMKVFKVYHHDPHMQAEQSNDPHDMHGLNPKAESGVSTHAELDVAGAFTSAWMTGAAVTKFFTAELAKHSIKNDDFVKKWLEIGAKEGSSDPSDHTKLNEFVALLKSSNMESHCKPSEAGKVALWSGHISCSLSAQNGGKLKTLETTALGMALSETFGTAYYPKALPEGSDKYVTLWLPACGAMFNAITTFYSSGMKPTGGKLPIYINQLKPSSVLMAFELPIIMGAKGDTKSIEFRIVAPPKTENEAVTPYLTIDLDLTAKPKASTAVKVKDPPTEADNGQHHISVPEAITPVSAEDEAATFVTALQEKIASLDETQVEKLWENMFNIDDCELNGDKLVCESSHPLASPPIGSRKVGDNAHKIYKKFFGAKFKASSSSSSKAEVAIMASAYPNSLAYPWKIFLIILVAISIIRMASFFKPKNKYSELQVEFSTDFDSI